MLPFLEERPEEVPGGISWRVAKKDNNVKFFLLLADSKTKGRSHKFGRLKVDMGRTSSVWNWPKRSHKEVLNPYPWRSSRLQ